MQLTNSPRISASNWMSRMGGALIGTVLLMAGAASVGASEIKQFRHVNSEHIRSQDGEATLSKAQMLVTLRNQAFTALPKDGRTVQILKRTSAPGRNDRALAFARCADGEFWSL